MSRAPLSCGDDCFYESFLTSGKEIKSLKSPITRKQLSPHEKGARDTFGLKNLNPFITGLIQENLGLGDPWIPVSDIRN